MYREDYLLREIQRISEFLLALMGKMQQKEISQQQFRESWIKNLTFTLESLMETPNDQLITLLDYKTGFNAANMELLADVLATLSARAAKEKAVVLYRLSAETDRTYSLPREYKIIRLEDELKST